jgi:hypothetical protein
MRHPESASHLENLSKQIKGFTVQIPVGDKQHGSSNSRLQTALKRSTQYTNSEMKLGQSNFTHQAGILSWW